MIGSRLSHFEITAKLGEGGMGVVYRATDSQLGREVAIKVLPEEFVADGERLARFEREARVLASLNHPNVATIHQVGQSEGRHFLVMELVDGEDLAARLAREPLSLRETLSVILEVSQGLEAAHEQGVIHRDLKPANIKLRPDGTAKVLDFGLAKALRLDVEEIDPGLSNSPTLPGGPTRLGVILGTASYLSPEQARGQGVDKRTDIWALGSVFYECLAGRRAFDAASMPDLLAQIVSEEPDFEKLPDETPSVVRWLLRRCFEKDPKRRLRDAGEVRIAIEDYLAGRQGGPFENAQPKTRAGRGRSPLLPWLLAAAFGLGFLYLWGTRPQVPEKLSPTVSRWRVPLPADLRIEIPKLGGKFDYSRMVAISPDGTRIAFSVSGRKDRSELFLKGDQALPEAIPGTLGARAPFFSPDGQWLGFYVRDGGHGALYRVSLKGGAPQKICDLQNMVHFDASWSPDGKTIVFATDDGLSLVGIADGSVERLTEPDPELGEIGHHSPRFTTDGRGVLFTISVADGMVQAVLSLEDGSWTRLLEDASLAVQVGSGRLVFARSGELLAVPYDSRGHRIVGSAVSVLQGVETTPGLGGMVLTQFDVSLTGTLVYLPAATIQPMDRLLWVDHSGRETLITEGVGTWVHPRLSPDGERISLDIHSPKGKRDVYIYELERGQFRELTNTGVSWESEWRPDGERIAVLSGFPAGHWSLFWVPTDFSRPAEILRPSRHAIPGSWLPDGKSLLYTEYVEGGVWRYWPESGKEPEVVLGTSNQEVFPRLSPSGRWMAYVASEAGRNEVFLQSFPDLGPKYKVSIDGGGEPVWSRDGRSLFYRKNDQMLSVDVTYEPALDLGQPRVLFQGDYDDAAVGHQHYDISLDGRRFLMIRHGNPSGRDEIRVVLGWSEEVGALISTH